MARNLSFLYQLLSVFLKRKAKRKTKKKKKVARMSWIWRGRFFIVSVDLVTVNISIQAFWLFSVVRSIDLWRKL